MHLYNRNSFDSMNPERTNRIGDDRAHIPMAELK